MLSGTCHCGAIRFDYDGWPEWLTRCTCSVCRRYAALWIHDRPAKFAITCAPEAATRYCWGDKTLAFVFCRTCGCVTHWEPTDPNAPYDRMAVNSRLCPPETVETVRIRTFDGADTWRFLD